ncbi:glucose-induced degradation protein 8 like protein [Vairimorpha necatrix]|uniref:Glucose-induced degradation protein 8 like protein n=1 Tax=Vairimorpha necatrix TaxID=6039 RepID=A0AAX4JGU8_9MICR
MLIPINDFFNTEVESLGNLSKYNSLIFDYFMHMGYGNLCINYAKDLDMDFTFPPLFLLRSKIRDLIESGNIEKAIEELNELDISIYRNKEVYVNITCHKAYELKFIKDEVEVIQFLREALGELALEYEKEVEDFLEYLIFNSTNVDIQEKRVELADNVNYFILENISAKENELEKIIKGIVLEENVLSKKNKFTDFKERILEK